MALSHLKAKIELTAGTFLQCTKNPAGFSGNHNPPNGNARSGNGEPLPLARQARDADEKKVQFFLPGRIAAFRLFYSFFGVFSAIICRFGYNQFLSSAEACRMKTTFIRGIFCDPKEENLQPDLLSVARSDSRLVRKSSANATKT